MFERNGIYYLTYPHVEDTTERLEYAIGDNPMGPFKVTGVIMDETPGCWTNQQSIIEFKINGIFSIIIMICLRILIRTDLSG